MSETELNERNPYLHGIYAPVTGEVSVDALEVMGELPRDLFGAYFRNGPNPKSPPAGMHHWFDGEGMVHAIHFEDGKARYRNRFVPTADLADERAGQPAMPGIFSQARSDTHRRTVYKDTANTDLVVHDGKLLALWYISGRPVAMDLRTLEPVELGAMGAAIPRNVSAHSKIDPKTGELVFFDYALYEPKMWTGTIAKGGALTHYQEIELPGPRLPHDMGMTENYVILHDLPVVFTKKAIENKVWQIKVADQPTRFGVVPRKGGEPKWFSFPTSYIYHVINSWEEGEEVVMVACKMVPNGFTPDPESHGPYAPMVTVLALRAQPFVWRMNMKTGEGREEQLDERLSEFPAIHQGYAGQKNAFSYHVVMDDHVEQRYSAVLKYDLRDGTSVEHRFGPGVYGSEPVFAPRASGTSEDDGYVITFATTAGGKSEALVIDAQNFSSPPIARVQLPHRVPAGFHATWADGAQLG